MQLEEMGLQIGSLLQIQMLDDETKRYTVQLIGFQRGQSLIVTAPKSAGSELSMILRDDQPLNIRIKTNKIAAAFRSRILEKRLTPYPHIHIAVPDEIESITNQQSALIAIDQGITFINDDDNSSSYQAHLTGISLTDAIIKHTETMAEKGQRVTVTLSFKFADKANVIVLEGSISSVSNDKESTAQTLTLTYDELDEQDRILLHAYIYERMLVNMKILDDPAC